MNNIIGRLKMKNIKILAIFITLLGLLLVSCDRDISEPVISSSPAKPAVADLSYSGQFTMSYADSSIGFSWSAADFGFQSSTTYGLQVSPSSSFTENVATLFTTQNLTGSAKVGDLNTLILSWKYDIGSSVQVYYRVYASVTSSNIVYSDSKSQIFTPYDAVINYPMVYVPGAYQGWSPGAENGRLFSYSFNSQYSGIIRIIDGSNATSEFKITSAASWSGTNWGGTLVKDGDSYTGTLDPSGGNYSIAAGAYAITVDVSALTIQLNKTNDWGIIGAFNSWSTSLPMFYNGQRKMWEITADFPAGEFKFRANNAWDINFGDGGDGTLVSNGSTNLSLAVAGNYTIRFSTETQKYTIKKN